jgi:hypothetical protein
MPDEVVFPLCIKIVGFQLAIQFLAGESRESTDDAHMDYGPRDQGCGTLCRQPPLTPQTVAEGAEGMQEVGDEFLLVVVGYFLAHGHEH